jgi:hypothetical protein
VLPGSFNFSDLVPQGKRRSQRRLPQKAEMLAEARRVLALAKDTPAAVVSAQIKARVLDPAASEASQPRPRARAPLLGRSTNGSAGCSLTPPASGRRTFLQDDPVLGRVERSYILHGALKRDGDILPSSTRVFPHNHRAICIFHGGG